MSARPKPAAAPAADEAPDIGVHAARLHGRAVAELSVRDARLREIVLRVGAFRLKRTPDPFHALVSSIVHQQVSMAAAAAIARRLSAACGDAISPEAIVALGPTGLRAAGISRQKAGYLHDLAIHFQRGDLAAETLRRLPDEEVIAAVTQVKGIGAWTAQMLLIFCLERPDVWPIGDFGLRKAVQKLLRRRELPDARRLTALGETWRPYRTYATWYLWRSLESPIQPGLNAD